MEHWDRLNITTDMNSVAAWCLLKSGHHKTITIYPMSRGVDRLQGSGHLMPIHINLGYLFGK